MSAYDRIAWHKFLESHEAGIEKSCVRSVQVADEHETGEYVEERVGSNAGRFAQVVLHWSHESSLPVSSTMVTFCGGVPTDRETVRVTLWVNWSLFGISRVLRGRARVLLRGLRWVDFGTKKGSVDEKTGWVSSTKNVVESESNRLGEFMAEFNSSNGHGVLFGEMMNSEQNYNSNTAYISNPNNDGDWGN
ncbi:mannose-binding lectin superfamily protein [Striga asiatica]|uniref:Mannose-binding lectin superfamily protein n=1 Tax=Striga asiatica TaxID=4170 RepID=A0A5A7P737_STRAF|nr:mannose-binding lectin superfamily protein [Striga asiatica]